MLNKPIAAPTTVHCYTCKRRTLHAVTAYDKICKVCQTPQPQTWRPTYG